MTIKPIFMSVSAVLAVALLMGGAHATEIRFEPPTAVIPVGGTLQVSVKADFGSQVAAGFGASVTRDAGVGVSGFTIPSPWSLSIPPSDLTADPLQFGGAIKAGENGGTGVTELARFTITAASRGTYKLSFVPADTAAGTADNGTINFDSFKQGSYEFGTEVPLAVTPVTRNVVATAGSATFDIATTASWSAASNQAWATLSATSGTGNQALTVNCTTNPGPGQRTATITVTGTGTNPASVQVQVVQAEPAPTLTVPASISVPAGGGSAQFVVETTASWQAADNQGWLAVSPASGTGTTTVTATADANNTGSTRTAIVTVTGNGTSPASAQVQVTQPSVATLSLTPDSRNVAAAAGTTTFNIIATAPWQVTDNAGWASVSPTSGTGNATITVTYNANTGAQRTAIVTVMGEGTTPASVPVTLIQVPAVENTVAPANRNVGPSADCVTFEIQTLGAWQAASSQPWVTVSPSSGTGNATLTACYQLNNGGQRTASITVTFGAGSPASLAISLVQTPPNALAVTPSSQNVGAATGSTTFQVTTSAAWTATSNQAWATVSPASGTGDQTLTVAYLTNAGAERTATVTVTGTGTTPAAVQATVVQAAAAGIVWTPIELNRTMVYYNCWEREGHITVPGATKVRLVLDSFMWDPYMQYDLLFVGSIDGWDKDEYGWVTVVDGTYNIYDGPEGEVTTDAVDGDTVDLLLDTDSTLTGSFVIRRVEYQSTSSGQHEMTGNLFTGSSGDDCDSCTSISPCEQCILDTKIAENFGKAAEPVETTLTSERNIGGLPPIVAAAGSKVWRLGPKGLYADAVPVKVPLNEAIPVEELEVWYYSETEGQEAWYRGENVEGWLVPDTLRVTEEDGHPYAEFMVTHSGVFQVVRVPQVNVAAVGPIAINASGSGKQWLLLAGTLAAFGIALVWTTWRSRRRPA